MNRMAERETVVELPWAAFQGQSERESENEEVGWSPSVSLERLRNQSTGLVWS
jgi:hypothetical protein